MKIVRMSAAWIVAVAIVLCHSAVFARAASDRALGEVSPTLHAKAPTARAHLARKSLCRCTLSGCEPKHCDGH